MSLVARREHLLAGFLAMGMGLSSCNKMDTAPVASTPNGESEAAGESQPVTWEEFQNAATRMPNGVYLFNGDEQVASLDMLKKSYQEYVEQVNHEGSHSGLAKAALVVDRKFSWDNIWSVAARNNISYCIDNTFNASEKTALVSALNSAGSTWRSNLLNRIQFVYSSANDGSSCTNTNANVVFNVTRVDLPGAPPGSWTVASSPMPDFPRQYSTMSVDPAAFTSLTSAQLTGTMLHELGHILGFRHEFLQPTSSCATNRNGEISGTASSPQYPGFRFVTPSDISSIMNYDACNGGVYPTALSAKDVSGALSLYTDLALPAFSSVQQAYTSGWNFGMPSSFATISGDINGDGLTDYIRMSGTAYFTFLSNGAGGYVQAQHSFPAGYNFGTPSSYPTFAGDFNKDGRMDFIRLGGTIAFTFLGNGDGTFNVVQNAYCSGCDFGYGLSQDLVGDFDGDGRTDFTRLWQGMEFLFIGNTSGGFTLSTYPWESGAPSFGWPSTWESKTLDAFGIGQSGYIRLGSDQYYIALYDRGGPGGTLRRQATWGSYPGGNSFGSPSNYKTIVGDFNGDNATDFARLGSTDFHVYLNNRNGSFTHSNPGFGNGWNFGLPSSFETIVGDFNGDHRADFSRMSGTTVFTFTSNGDGTFTGSSQGFPNGWDFGTPSQFETLTGDYNGNGKTDFLRISGLFQFTELR